MTVGQMSVGQMSLNPMTVGQMSVGQMSVSQMSVGQMSVGQMSVGQMSVGQMSVGQLSFCQTVFDQMSRRQSNVSTIHKCPFSHSGIPKMPRIANETLIQLDKTFYWLNYNFAERNARKDKTRMEKIDNIYKIYF